MPARNCASVIAILATAAISFGCGGGGSSTSSNSPPAITVSASPATITVQPQASSQFTATVSNDSSAKGVTWSMTCNGATCGLVTPTTTASGAAATYTAPSPPVVTLMVVLTATAVADTTKSATVAITVPAPTTVSVSPQSAIVASGGTQQFTANVGNDPAKAGVTWQLFAELFCTAYTDRGCVQPGAVRRIYLPCSGCGSVSPASTASGAPMTYTAPGYVTPPSKPGYYFCGYCAGTVLMVATSVTYTAGSAIAYLSFRRISVSVSPGSAKVVLRGTQQFTATVTNDGSGNGVSWSLSQNGINCSPTCGTITPTRTASGVAATYTAPTDAPVSPLVTVTTTSIEDATKVVSGTVMVTNTSGRPACSAGSGSEALLKGRYAFLLQGDLSNFGQGSAAGSLTADGTGNITAGEEDLIGPETVNIDPAASSYAMGPEHRGCVVLTDSNGKTSSFSIALGSINSSNVASAGRVNRLDSTLYGGFRAAGTLGLQDSGSFGASDFSGHYVLGFIGSDQQNVQNGSRRVAIAGTFAADGVSAISSATFDINDVGSVTSNLSSAPAGSFTCCDANGRGTLTLGNLRATNMAFYMINSGRAFLVANDNNADAVQGVGEAIAIASSTTFTQASLSGISVMRETAQSASGAMADIATASSNGTGAVTVNDNVNNAGTFSSSSTPLTYSVAANGRVTTSGGSTPPVLYLYGPDRGFLVGTDPDVSFGVVEPQAAGPMSNASFSGSYILGTEGVAASTVTTQSGVVTADGNGNASGAADQSSPATLPQSESVNFTYSLPANGVGNAGSGTTAIVISGNKLVFISNTSANPTITVVEK